VSGPDTGHTRGAVLGSGGADAKPQSSRAMWIIVWVLAYVLSYLCSGMVGVTTPFRTIVGASIGLVLTLPPYFIARRKGRRLFGERALLAGAVVGAISGAALGLAVLPLAIVLTIVAADKEPLALPVSTLPGGSVSLWEAAGHPASQRSRMWAAVTGRWAMRGTLVALLLMAASLLSHTLGFTLAHRIDDRAGILHRLELHRFEDYLALIEQESGVDVRFVFVDSVENGSLEQFAVREARALGIGRELDRRSMLFVYDASRRRLRIEVGPTLQGIFTDRFVGYLMRHHVGSFFASGDPNLGLRLTIRMLHARLRRAAERPVPCQVPGRKPAS